MDTTTLTDARDSEERAMLREAAARYVERDYPADARRAAMATPDGFSRERWGAFAEMGWLALGLPADCGGLGDAGDAEGVAHALGRVAAVEPWLANVGLAAPAIAWLHRRGGGVTDAVRAHRAGLLGALAEGRTCLALACWEPQGRHDAFDVATRAMRDGQDWILDGTKTLVLGGGAADVLLVLARESGEPRATDGLALFAVPADAPGLSRRTLPTYDGRQAADLRLEGVRVPPAARLDADGDAWAAVEHALDTATALGCAEAVGTMAAVIDATRGYLQQRRQFGRPLAANQVLRHRLVDLWAAMEQSRAIAGAAIERLDDAPAARRRAVSLAKAFVGPAARACGEDGIQLHGAIGMTDELPFGQLAKRLIGFANLLGDEAWHLERLAG
jgi:butyryl-CoA dehydrogenase